MGFPFASGIEGLLRRLDASAERRLAGMQLGSMRGGQMAQREGILSREPQQAAEYIVDRTPSFVQEVKAAPTDQYAATRGRMVEAVMADLAQGKEAAADRYYPDMNRGLMGGEAGIRESMAALANRKSVRRTGLGAAGLGAAAGTGALLTEGAQQLITLMDFLQAGEDTRERAERSPLA